MKFKTKFMLFLGYAAVSILTFIHCYFLSLIASGALLSIVCAVYSIVSKLPEVLTERFWLIYLTSSVPIAVIFFVIVITDVTDKKGGFKKAI